MDKRKIGWVLRGLRYKFSFGYFGNLSYIGKPVSLSGVKNIYISDRVRIYPGVRMEVYNSGKIIIEENTSIAQNFHITAEKEKLVIGKNTTILGNVFITNIDHEYQDINQHILKQKWITKSTRIGEGCFIGFGAAIQAGTILGKHCIVGTNSVVRGIFPDYCVIVGAPGRIVKQYNPVSKEWEKI
ncbi:putative acetyltransferase [Lachnospiraceae bacterium]|nr:putative acetyltransferase [Lachnospiraceae bacterium]